MWTSWVVTVKTLEAIIEGTGFTLRWEPLEGFEQRTDRM